MREYHYKPKIDLTGQKFGRLTVIGLDQEESDKQHKGIYICNCDCGTKGINVDMYLLREGLKKSCNCLRKETTLKRISKHNTYEFYKDYVIGYTDCNPPTKASYDSQGRNYFYVDIEDYDKIKDYYWKFNDQDYVITSTLNDIEKYGKYPRLHRIIMGLTTNDKIDVDHIKGDKTRNDNRKSNLRLGSRTENNMNAKIRANNTSGVTGVSYRKKDKFWEAYISKDKKVYKLGIFKNYEEAVEARKKAEEELFGNWSYINSQKQLGVK